jgi:hypothetical protein
VTERRQLGDREPARRGVLNTYFRMRFAILFNIGDGGAFRLAGAPSD